MTGNSVDYLERDLKKIGFTVNEIIFFERGSASSITYQNPEGVVVVFERERRENPGSVIHAYAMRPNPQGGWMNHRDFYNPEISDIKNYLREHST